MCKLIIITAIMNTSTKAEGLTGMDLTAIAEKTLLIYFSLPLELRKKAAEFAVPVPEDVADSVVHLLKCFHDGDRALKLLKYFQDLKDMEKKQRDVEAGGSRDVKAGGS